MRSAPDAEAERPDPAAGRPPMLLLAAGAQGLEAAGLVVVVVANLIDLATGHVDRSSSGIAFIAVEVIVAAGVAAVAAGLARMRPWSRTPAVLTQVFGAFVAIWLLEAHRVGWGVPALLLVIAGLVGLFAPASLRALHRGD